MLGDSASNASSRDRWSAVLESGASGDGQRLRDIGAADAGQRLRREQVELGAATRAAGGGEVRSGGLDRCDHAVGRALGVDARQRHGHQLMETDPVVRHRLLTGVLGERRDRLAPRSSRDGDLVNHASYAPGGSNLQQRADARDDGPHLADERLRIVETPGVVKGLRQPVSGSGDERRQDAATTVVPCSPELPLGPCDVAGQARCDPFQHGCLETGALVGQGGLDQAACQRHEPVRLACLDGGVECGEQCIAVRQPILLDELRGPAGGAGKDLGVCHRPPRERCPVDDPLLEPHDDERLERLEGHRLPRRRRLRSPVGDERGGLHAQPEPIRLAGGRDGRRRAPVRIDPVADEQPAIQGHLVLAELDRKRCERLVQLVVDAAAVGDRDELGQTLGAEQPALVGARHAKRELGGRQSRAATMLEGAAQEPKVAGSMSFHLGGEPFVEPSARLRIGLLQDRLGDQIVAGPQAGSILDRQRADP